MKNETPTAEETSQARAMARSAKVLRDSGDHDGARAMFTAAARLMRKL